MNKFDSLLPMLLSILRTDEQSINKGKTVLKIQVTMTNGDEKNSKRKPKAKGRASQAISARIRGYMPPLWLDRH